MISIYARLAVISAALLALAGVAWKLHHSGAVAGRAQVQTKWDAEKLEQTQKLANFNEAQRHLERALNAKLAKAQNDRIQKTLAAKPVADAVAAELGGLSRDVYALNSDASGQPATACKIAAITARSVFEQCVKRYTEVARAADGHDADALMLEQGWPK